MLKDTLNVFPYMHCALTGSRSEDCCLYQKEINFPWSPHVHHCLFCCFLFTEHCLETYHTVKRTEKTTITCNYQDQRIKSNVKFFCRENRFTCESILSTNRKSNGSFSLRETPGGFQVSISGVSANDAGVYWCAVKGRDYQRGVQKITLQVKGEEHIWRLRCHRDVSFPFSCSLRLGFRYFDHLSRSFWG